MTSAAFDFGDEGAYRLEPQRVVGAGQVDEVRAVGHDGMDAGGCLGLDKGLHLVVRQILRRPAVGVPGKDLDGVTPDGMAALQCLGGPSRDRHVRAEARSEHDVTLLVAVGTILRGGAIRVNEGKEDGTRVNADLLVSGYR